MPYLMLNFVAEREHESVENLLGQETLRPTGKEHIKFRMIETDKGKVVELEADATNVRQVERDPEWVEMHTASQVLSKGVGEQISKIEYDRIQAELTSYRQKVMSAEQQIANQKALVKQLTRKNAELKAKVVSDDDAAIISSAMDDFITNLALNGPYDQYENAKKIFKRMTGMSWNPDEDPDDPEEDLADEPGFAIGGEVRFEVRFEDHQRESLIRWDENTESDPIRDLKKFQEHILKDLRKEPLYFTLEMGEELYLDSFREIYLGGGKKSDNKDLLCYSCPLCGSATDKKIPDTALNREMRRSQRRGNFK